MKIARLLGGFIVSFSPTNHSGSKYVDLTMIGRHGKFLRRGRNRARPLGRRLPNAKGLE
jgi:hypothetical protein